MKPNTQLGQHFLSDENVIHQILSVFRPQPHDHVLEIGPGLGALTHPLLEILNQLIAIDIDPRIIQYWTQHPHKHLQVIHVDALKYDYTQHQQLRLISNLPYQITSPLLLQFTKIPQHFCDLLLMVQAEVAHRICAPQGQFSRLSVMLQTFFHCQYLFNIPPEAFSPPPKVDSAIIHLRPKTAIPWETSRYQHFETMVQQLFSQPRKMLRQVFRQQLSANDWETLKIEPTQRAQHLSLEDIQRLVEQLS